MSSKGPLIQFGRFVNGQLELFQAHTDELEYVAISHVWGNAEWLQVEGIPHEIFVSHQKAKFIKERLPTMIQDRALWMDVLTVNQRDRTEVVATTGSIPSIFRHSIKTIAIREGDGLYDCCAKAIEGFSEWEDIVQKLSKHAESHYGHVYNESYLQRLWTFQECLLSQTIEFVTACSDIRKDETRNYMDTYHYMLNYQRVSDSLYVLAHSFQYPNTINNLEGMYDFIRAYVSNGTITKSRFVARSLEDDLYTGNFLIMNRSSSRCASMPRDYIFATMPQFPWYRLPKDAKSLTFDSIFLDFHRQATNVGRGFACRFTHSMTDPENCHDSFNAWLPSKQQPKPESLGDFFKLLGERWPGGGDLESCFFTTVVKVTACSKELIFDSAMTAVESAMKISPRIWGESHHGGELSAYGSEPDRDNEFEHLRSAIESWTRPNRKSDHSQSESRLRVKELQAELVELERLRTDDKWIFSQARKILDFMWCAVDEIQVNIPMRSDRGYLKRNYRDSWTLRLQQAFMLLASMVSCQVPLSAADWVDERFIPVHLEFKNRTILGLLAKHACTESISTGQPMLCAGRHFDGESSGMDLVLVDPLSKMPVGLIPDFLHRNRTDEEYMDRIKILFEGLNPILGPRGAIIPRVSLDAISMHNG